MDRRNLMIPQEMWEAVQRAALEEGLQKGQPVSASAWVRNAISQKLTLWELHKKAMADIHKGDK